MEARSWKVGETFSDYFYEKLKLTDKQHLPERDIVPHVIEGINNYVLRIQALAARFAQLNIMLEFMNLVTENQTCRPPSDSRDERQALTPRRMSTNTSNSRPSRPINNSTTLKCFNCNQEGHYASIGSRPRREKASCFNCGQMDHQSHDCRTNIRQTRDSTTATALVTRGADQVH